MGRVSIDMTGARTLRHGSNRRQSWVGGGLLPWSRQRILRCGGSGPFRMTPRTPLKWWVGAANGGRQGVRPHPLPFVRSGGSSGFPYGGQPRFPSYASTALPALLGTWVCGPGGRQGLGTAVAHPAALDHPRGLPTQPAPWRRLLHAVPAPAPTAGESLPSSMSSFVHVTDYTG